MYCTDLYILYVYSENMLKHCINMGAILKCKEVCKINIQYQLRVKLKLYPDKIK